jgi:hypothetical protein
MTELEEALKDWAENERDIRMCEAAIAGGCGSRTRWNSYVESWQPLPQPPEEGTS